MNVTTQLASVGTPVSTPSNSLPDMSLLNFLFDAGVADGSGDALDFRSLAAAFLGNAQPSEDVPEQTKDVSNAAGGPVKHSASDTPSQEEADSQKDGVVALPLAMMIPAVAVPVSVPVPTPAPASLDLAPMQDNGAVTADDQAAVASATEPNAVTPVCSGLPINLTAPANLTPEPLPHGAKLDGRAKYDVDAPAFRPGFKPMLDRAGDSTDAELPQISVSAPQSTPRALTSEDSIPAKTEPAIHSDAKEEIRVLTQPLTPDVTELANTKDQGESTVAVNAKKPVIEGAPDAPATAQQADANAIVQTLQAQPQSSVVPSLDAAQVNAVVMRAVTHQAIDTKSPLATKASIPEDNTSATRAQAPVKLTDSSQQAQAIPVQQAVVVDSSLPQPLNKDVAQPTVNVTASTSPKATTDSRTDNPGSSAKSNKSKDERNETQTAADAVPAAQTTTMTSSPDTPGTPLAASVQPQASAHTTSSGIDNPAPKKDQALDPTQSMPASVADDTSLPAHSLVNTAKLVAGLAQAEFRVGMQSREFGQIDIRTSVARHEFTAQISVEHSEVAKVMASDLPGLYNRLAEQQVPVANIQIQHQGFSTSAGFDREAQQQAPSSQSQSTSSTVTEPAPMPIQHAFQEAASTGRLDIRI